ncbi:hypothetical protein [Photobacterium sp. GB-72]|uniref:hypothetical protein n=1 Tax=Photobacterium sp. GB-72 TaxID=2022105 RepID=UPI000D174650|nr:hypothetical protein [Photobacterium sp. GB-72]PSV28004.1 hypothetical protein C9J40_19760 [Photobacterium sp. GB-72]
MCKQTNYSKYQKRAIKFLSDFLGAEIPFTYEKTQTNHLKVLIDGVPKPLFTGSTPSDCKSINNFMAEVKREVKASKETLDIEQDTSVVKILLPTPFKQSQDKLIQNCVKSLRTRLEVMKSQEEQKVLEEKSVNVVSAFRSEAIKHALSFALQSRRQGGYIKPKEMKSLEAKIGSHLNFMMPTLAYYSELLESKTKYQEKLAIVDKEALKNVHEPKFTQEPEVEVDCEPNVFAKQSDELTNIQIDRNVQQIKQSSALELMAMPSNNRVSLLRGLSKSQSLKLIDDINQAMTQNREDDIKAVIAMIKEKDLPLELIISRLDAA